MTTSEKASPELIGSSENIVGAREFAQLTGGATHNVLIRGETGTGKEILARMIHDNGRRGKPFIPINCGGISDEMLESLLFGHVRGAFTGAVKDHPGFFVSAGGGTIFLDEVESMSSHLQATLLRVIEYKRVCHVGGATEIDVDVRVITASNNDLEHSVSEREFRDDLFFRLNVLPYTLSPLRERKGDIPELIAHFLRLVKQESRQFSPGALEVLMEYSWPGNVRELRSMVERATLFSKDGERQIETEYVLPHLVGAKPSRVLEEIDLTVFTPEELNETRVRQALKKSGGDVAKARSISGMTEKQMRYAIEKYNLRAFIAHLRYEVRKQ